ncbi:enoyl-CoA hydratase/isomerase family protein [Aquabacterium sp.]|uniref:enoyl-CoA hydratase/isomerase family protein n=1 Tax=Aquabacterium sp. TaxID=1872578 RepID=UPI002C85F50B|nr:enoyl-CoA hydratase/isomerase family protein [Aquabacterium sp.]HSW07294.1 enoyl-CoA hydratase/isomerase family protein [Aquabacterium sp.]
MSADVAPTLDIEGDTATITLRRPSQHNRIDPDDPPLICRYIDQVRAQVSLRLLVLTGEGGKTFCSGYTLGRIGTHLDRSFEDMLDMLEAIELPTLCLMNGSAYGGGTDLAMACDFRIGVRGCRLFMPAARFGLHYYPGGLRRFVTRLGPTATKKIFLTAATMVDEELLRIGFLTELVDRPDLPATMARYREDIRRCEPDAVRSMKHHIDSIAAGTWSEEGGRAAYQASLRSPETLRRLALLNAGPVSSPSAPTTCSSRTLS